MSLICLWLPFCCCDIMVLGVSQELACTSPSEGVLMTVERWPLAGWYPDPAGQGRLRFWDGTQWAARAVLPCFGSCYSC